ncbi:ZrgA family zinc uptake protein [Pseudorhodoferax sp.]|uniref:ZrgA family zinc uptake protein n=1 Tax=Pseudorhodoferax sp. TaxID=1993553 RepID=UPI0039E2E7A9
MSSLRKHPVRVAALALALAAPALAPAHEAHTHGRIELDVAVEAQRLSLRMESPLHDLLGFERAPRSVAERGRATALAERLRAADQLFVPDAAAECTLAEVGIEAPVLGLGTAAPAASAASAAPGPAGEAHADLVLTASFDCRRTAQHLDVRLFDAFPGVRTVAAQVAGPGGQGLTLLRKAAARLPLVR